MVVVMVVRNCGESVVVVAVVALVWGSSLSREVFVVEVPSMVQGVGSSVLLVVTRSSCRRPSVKIARKHHLANRRPKA